MPLGMKEGEVFLAESFLFHQGDGQRLAQGQCGRRARGGHHVLRAGFAFPLGVEDNITEPSDPRLRVSGDGDELDAYPLDELEEVDDLFGFSAVGDGQDDVVRQDHAQVAVSGLGRMDEQRRRPATGQGSGNLTADESRLSHAGYYDPRLAFGQEVDRPGEILVQPGNKGGNGPAFDVQNSPSYLDDLDLLHAPITSPPALR